MKQCIIQEFYNNWIKENPHTDITTLYPETHFIPLTHSDIVRYANDVIDNYKESIKEEAKIRSMFNKLDIIPLSQQKLKPKIKDVIFNDPATIVFWSDGTKTVVKTQDNEMGDHEIYDPEKGLAMAIAKKALGNNREYYHTFLHWLKKYEKENTATKEICKNVIDKLSKNIYELKFTPMSDAKKEAAKLQKQIYEELGVITTKKQAAVQKAYDLLVKYGPTEGDMILNEVIGYLGEALED